MRTWRWSPSVGAAGAQWKRRDLTGGDDTSGSPAWLRALAIGGVLVIAGLDAFVPGFDVLPLWGYPVWISAIALGERIIPFVGRGN